MTFVKGQKSPGKVFVKGQVSNPKGRPKGKNFTEYARSYLAEVIDEKTGRTRGQQVAEDWVTNAVATPALMLELINRIDGKQTNHTDVTSNGETIGGDVNKLELEQRLLVLFETVAARPELPALESGE